MRVGDSSRLPVTEFRTRLRLIAAASVHGFTGLGAIFGLFALLDAVGGAWERCFAWLGAALFVDGADGPLARVLDVKTVLPRFSGEDIDNVVDYLTYVTVPAVILARSDLLPQPWRLVVAAAVMFVSLYHFADKTSKTANGYFVGFPAIWNVAVFYILVLGLPPEAALLTVAICAGLTFAPLYWLHPLRVRRLRLFSIFILAVWSVTAAASVSHGFPGALWHKAILGLAAVYFAAVGFTGKQDAA